jgi:hypothetical protein
LLGVFIMLIMVTSPMGLLSLLPRLRGMLDRLNKKQE